MQILVRDPYYGKEETHDDWVDKFYEEMRVELGREFPECTLKEVDAGPSASVPALLIEYLFAGLLVYSAPHVILESTRAWKVLFDKVASFFASRKLDYSFDHKTALNLATFYVLNRARGTFNTFWFTYAIRHWSNLGGSTYEVVRLDDESPEPSKVVSLDAESSETLEAIIHHQAVRQMWCRYIIGAELDGTALTIIIEKDGRCGYIEQL